MEDTQIFDMKHLTNIPLDLNNENMNCSEVE